MLIQSNWNSSGLLVIIKHSRATLENRLAVSFFFLIKLKNFCSFFLCQVFVATCGLSLVAVNSGYSVFAVDSFSLRWLLLFQARALGHAGFSSRSTGAPQVRCVHLVAPRKEESSWTRNQAHIPCISWQILNHGTTKEDLVVS